VAWGFEGGWARAQEARAARFYRARVFDWLVRPLPAAYRPMVAKEMRLFVRDPSQWSQIFLLIGVCAIYLVSIQALPMSAFSGPVLEWMKQAIAFLNLGMGGFVMAAIGARFQFIAVSREGRAWWLVRGAPIDPATTLRAKAMLGMVPMVVVGQVVVVGSGLLLQAPAQLLIFEAVVTVFLAYAISGLAITTGALWPDFRADTAARAASSPAAVFFMVVALFLVFVVLTLQAGGLWLWLKGASGWAAAPAAAGAAICVAVGRWPVRRAAETLWARGL
jgi:ABC-2 type transport system permease protein